MASTYAAANSYADRGVVTITEGADRLSYGDYDWVADHFIKPRTRVVGTRTFTTAFERPNRFRFEYRVEGDRSRAHVVWTTPKGRARSMWYVQRGVVTDNAMLAYPLAGATGVSSGVAQVVPRLLLPGEVGGIGLDQLRDPRLDAIEDVGGQPCFRVVARGVRAEPRTLWIDVGTYLLRQTADRYYHRGGSTFWETTIRYEPQIDVQLTEAQFAAPDTSGMRIRRSSVSDETERAMLMLDSWLSR